MKAIHSQITTYDKTGFMYPIRIHSKPKMGRTNIKCSKKMSIPYNVRSYDDLIAYGEKTYGVNMSDIQDKRVQVLWSNFEEILTEHYRKKEKKEKMTQDLGIHIFCVDNPDDEMCRLYDI